MKTHQDKYTIKFEGSISVVHVLIIAAFLDAEN